MKRREIVGVVLLAASLSFVHAAEGRTPIWKPTVITQAGSYVVTRNIGIEFTEDCGVPGLFHAIDIQASNVDVDLNGFTLYCGDPPIMAAGVGNVRIHDGTVTGYDRGIRFTNVTNFSIRRVKVDSNEGTVVSLEAVSGGVVEDTFIANPATPSPQLVLTGSNVELRHVTFQGGFFATNLDMTCTGCRIVESTFGHTVASIGGSGNLVAGNSVTGGSIIVAGSGNRIVDNVVSGSSSYDGIRINGDRNQIVGNVSTGNAAFGIRLTGNDNVYRGNTARGNQGAGCTNPAGNANLCDGGTGNTSHGDNYMPSQM